MIRESNLGAGPEELFGDRWVAATQIAGYYITAGFWVRIIGNVGAEVQQYWWNTAAVTVGVYPEVTLTADPPNVPRGSFTRLTWNSTNARSVVSSNFEAGSGQVSGTAVALMGQSKTFTITVANEYGQASASVTVGAKDEPPGPWPFPWPPW
jgi:hypothetical protein